MRTSVACWAGIAALGVACDRVPVQALQSPASPIAAHDVVQFAASPSGSTGTHHGVVRAVNAFGAAVPSAPLPAMLDGRPIEVAFDPLGYGSVETLDPGVSELTGADVPVTLHTLATPWIRPDLHVAWASGATSSNLAVATQSGVALVEGAEMWWVGPGMGPHVVLRAPTAIRGLRSRHLDLDGILDVVAWTAEQVFLLRGRHDGGLAWAGAWEAEGFTVGGADVADATDDLQPDLVIAWNRPSDARVDLWTGDGRGHFDWGHTGAVDQPVVDLLMQDATARGQVQVTLLHAEARAWSRFVAVDDTLVPIGPTIPALDVAPDAGVRLLPTHDANADSGDDITIVGHDRASMLDLATEDAACSLGTANAQCAPEVSAIGHDGARHFARGDSNDDRVDDVWFADQSRTLFTSFWLAPLRSRSEGPVLDLPALGPLAIRDIDLDGAPEVHLAAPDRVWRWGGRARPNDSVVSWSPRTLPSTTVRARVSSHFGLYEIDGSPTTNEIVIFTHENNDTRIKVVQYTHEGGRAAQLGALRLVADKAPPVDFEMCGTAAWFALDGAAWRVDLSQPDLPRLAGHFPGSVRAVDCVVTPEVIYAAYLSGSRVFLQASAGPSLDPLEDLASASDLAIGATAKGPVVETCEGDCSIVFWPLGDGPGVFASSDPSGTYVDGQRVGPHHGTLSVADVDGDGTLDLIGVDAQQAAVFVHRSTGASAAPAELFHDGRSLVGKAWVADGSGDGWPDLWMLDADGEVQFTRPPELPTR